MRTGKMARWQASAAQCPRSTQAAARKPACTACARRGNDGAEVAGPSTLPVTGLTYELVLASSSIAHVNLVNSGGGSSGELLTRFDRNTPNLNASHYRHLDTPATNVDGPCHQWAMTTPGSAQRPLERLHASLQCVDFRVTDWTSRGRLPWATRELDRERCSTGRSRYSRVIAAGHAGARYRHTRRRTSGGSTQPPNWGWGPVKMLPSRSHSFLGPSSRLVGGA